MSQQFPPSPPQPGHGYPGFPPPPKKRMSTGAIVAIVLGSVFGGLLLLGIIGAALSDDTAATGQDKGTPTAEAPAQKKAPAAAAEPEKAKAEKKPEPEPEPEVKVTAKKATFTPSILNDGGAFTSVKVTVTNNSDKKISINPLYFTITDTNSTKHEAELGEDENQINTMDLAPGENVSGIITGEGRFTPKYVTYVDGLFGEGVRGDVN
ncbi:DUF4352 domain-containing protein [Streptomyces sp. NPDC004609]|uniref:DUF4352 domain-containing protein n=1 Tax=Streptomyces sp. NPDC004609 TaxID=3364704 RepID=UPI00369A60AC